VSSPPVFSGIRVTQSLVLCVCFVDRCLPFRPFSFGHCVVCSSSIYGFWSPLLYLQTLLTLYDKISMIYLIDLASLNIFFFVSSSDFSRVTAKSKSIYHLTYRCVSGITFIRYVHSKSLEIQIIKTVFRSKKHNVSRQDDQNLLILYIPEGDETSFKIPATVN